MKQTLLADKYAIFGNPVEHSLSPAIYDIFARNTHQHIEYCKIKPEHHGFELALRKFIHDGGKGCNITFPFKEQAFKVANESSSSAHDAGAASCLLIRKNGAIYADNYDGTGLIQDLSHNYEFSFLQKKVLIIGAGGATRGILGPLLEMAPSQITVANRTEKKAFELAERYRLRGYISGVGLDAIDVAPYDLIIHATTAGHAGRMPSLPDGIVGHRTWCYDISYGKAAAPFLAWAKAQSAEQVLDGLGMLVEHNAAAFYLWRNIYPDTKPVIEELRRIF